MGERLRSLDNGNGLIKKGKIEEAKQETDANREEGMGGG